eukprot:g6983.t1
MTTAVSRTKALFTSKSVVSSSARAFTPGLCALPPPVQGRRLWSTPSQTVSEDDTHLVHCSADSSPSVTSDLGSTLHSMSETFCNLFPIWLAASSVVGALKPDLFLWITTDSFTVILAVLMFSMGVTLTIDDFKRVAQKPGPVAINFLACYGVMPALGYVVGKMMGLPTPHIAGLVLVGATNGGQSSNLCTYIAKGDVALSVLMTTSTTIGCLFMTPLICKLVLGAVVPLDAVGIAISTFQVVLVPIILGVFLNKVAHDACRKVEPFCPIVGILATVVLVGASIAKCADLIMNGGLSLQVPCVIFHLVGGLLGYFLCKMFNYNEKISRTTAIETSMKSSAFSFLLAALHFGDPLVRVIPAISLVWMAIIGSSLAVFWRGIDVEEEAA